MNACHLILGFTYDMVNVGVFLVLEDYRVFFDCGLWGFLLWLLVWESYCNSALGHGLRCSVICWLGETVFLGWNSPLVCCRGIHPSGHAFKLWGHSNVSGGWGWYSNFIFGLLSRVSLSAFGLVAADIWIFFVWTLTVVGKLTAADLSFLSVEVFPFVENRTGLTGLLRDSIINLFPESIAAHAAILGSNCGHLFDTLRGTSVHQLDSVSLDEVHRI